MATHSSVLAWRIPGMGEPDGLPSMGSHRVRHHWSNLAAAAAASQFRLSLGRVSSLTTAPLSWPSSLIDSEWPVLSDQPNNKSELQPGLFGIMGPAGTNNYCCCLATKSRLTLVTPWTVARQAPLSMGFPRQEYWSVLPFPFPGDLPGPGTEPALLHWQADS